MTWHRSPLAFAVAAILFVSSSAAAQARKGSWEIAPGAVWSSGIDLGSSVATLERPGGGEFELFTTDTRLEPAFGAALTASFFATPRFAIEVGFAYARPEVSSRVGNDAEGAAPIASVIGLQQYLVEGNLRWYLARRRAGWQPFLRAGAGYLRELDDANAGVESGSTVQAGIGADRAFRDRNAGGLRRIGLRAEARAVGRTGGFDVEDSLRIGFAAGASIFFGF